MSLQNTKDSAAVAGPDDVGPSKARKACVNCRKQKMKCRLDNGSTCRRCLRAGVPCVFVPRANSASHRDSISLASILHANEQSSTFNKSVILRLKRLEEHLGLPTLGSPDEAESPTSPNVPDLGPESPGDDSLGPLWGAVAILRRTCSSRVGMNIWEKAMVKRLWLSFHETMPGLHFLPTKQTFSSPRPLMLASMLYCSSIRGPPEVAVLAPDYFAVLCSAISQLCIPENEIGQVPDDPASAEEWAFQTVLGIILAGLLREGVVKETGLWISVAYRLILEHCPSNVEERSREWRRLFSGLQIVDLEHASIHLSCPIIPIEAPLPRLKIPMQDQLYRLSRMMHTGLTHFTGRSLPTIWSYFANEPSISPDSTVTFSGVDGAVIRDWARQLDDWLVEFSDKDFDSEHEKKLVFRQYILHRLLVLSIYHPARGCDLFSNTTPKEQHELLVSARAAVKLQILDSTIWSNWDLVMITWAALIVLQGVDGGVGEPDDLENARVHLQKLREMHEPKPSLRGILASRLEQKLQGLHTPGSGDAEIYEQQMGNLDNSWYIFDQTSLQAGYELWSYEHQGG
ncbi:C6 finger domain-containing protein [Colletotrichum truncatum]|uniref:C6 finger domain-containing protein n=1 Tax=Colletotrichum truncatum TaxID=5467 RepID=A0ACC3ZGR5_COLTU|nr:C6 finger domain-containing protein [Colletotrichum truncatum]KAF6790498.1 C6 finger domain-containing protein [Colletotrichum truncatum]